MKYEEVKVGEKYRITISDSTDYLKEGEIVKVTGKIINALLDNPFCEVKTDKGMCFYVPPVRLKVIEE